MAAACMVCRVLLGTSGSTHMLQKPLFMRSTVLKNVHRSAWYRSLFQSDREPSSQSTQTEGSRSSSNSQLSKPKQPPNVFLLYIAKVQDIIKKENPNANRLDIVNEASQRWKELNPEEKSKLALERKELFEKFKEDKRFYLENITPEQLKTDLKERATKESKKLKKARKNLGMPVKPWSSYKWFLSEKFAERAGEDTQTYFKKAKDLWLQLSPEEKEIYLKKQRESQVKYQRDMIAWESSMIEDGRFDVVRKGTLAKLKQQSSRHKEKKDAKNVAD